VSNGCELRVGEILCGSAVCRDEPPTTSGETESVVTCGTGVGWLTRDHFPSDEMWGRFERLMDETKNREQVTDEEAGRLLKECFDIFNGLAQAQGASNIENNERRRDDNQENF
jgi:hypothetical protein